jgi:hypothetical protein
MQAVNHNVCPRWIERYDKVRKVRDVNIGKCLSVTLCAPSAAMSQIGFVMLRIYARFEVLTALKLRIKFFYDVKLCN